MTCYREIGTVQKPYQYVGHEENTYKKDFASSQARLCLAFPDAYEIGMSNVGMQILYHVVNEQQGLLADRVYAPLTDMGAMLKATGQKLLGKESGEALAAFDVVGFTLQYELCYTNVLYMLELGGIPRRTQDRGEGDPLVMGGGPCAFNPEPVAAFFDFFVIGEGEDAIVDVLDAIASAKDRKLSRRATLVALQQIQGVYVPAHYHPVYDEATGRFTELTRGPHAPKWIERRIVKDLDKVPYPTKPVTPAIQPVHERVSVEIQRGCTRSCRFCQAGYIYRPRRERSPQKVMDIIEASVAATGITDIGLLSLSSADYSHLHPLMKTVMDRYKAQHLSVSLPSTRLEALSEDYLDVLKEERRQGFTIAPEAGSQRLRNVINKNFTEEEVVETARMLFRNGWQSVKMYFMIGQPTETDEDVIAIAELGNTVIRRTMDIPGRKHVTISVSNFVPKPHTPFQWHQQISHDEILRKQKLVRDAIAFRHQISFRCHSADNSFAEGILARGDRRVASLIERAYDRGAVFDCWQDRFDVALWRNAVAELKEELGVDFAVDGLRGRDLEERLPWHRIHCGIHPKFFKNEFTKAVYGLATEDCSFAACHECGLCHEKSGVAPLVHKDPLPVVARLTHDDEPPVGPLATWRFQFLKIDAGAYVSTLDLQNLMARAFMRAGVRIAYDAGNRPRPRLTLGPALPLGVSSRCELMDLVLETGLEAAEIIARVNRHLPDHAALLTGAKLDAKEKGLTHLIRAVSYRVDATALYSTGFDREGLAARIAAIDAAPSVIVRRERKTRDGEIRLSVIDVKTCVEALRLVDDAVEFTLAAPDGQAPSPFLVVDALRDGLSGLGDRLIPIVKTGFQAARA